MHIENVIMIINVRNKCKLVEDGLSKKLEDMSLEELWQLFPIFLVKHNKEWADWYDEELEIVKNILVENNW